MLQNTMTAMLLFCVLFFSCKSFVKMHKMLNCYLVFRLLYKTVVLLEGLVQTGL